MFSFEKDAIKKATERLKEILDDNLVAMAAFGSRVRGDFYRVVFPLKSLP